MPAFPNPGCIFVRFRHSRVNMHRLQHLVQAQIICHRQDKLGNQLRRLFADYGHAEDFIPAGFRQHLDEAVRHAVGNRPVQLIDVISADFEGYALRLRILLIKADARNFLKLPNNAFTAAYQA